MSLKIYNKEFIQSLTRQRQYETKIGESVQVFEENTLSHAALKNYTAKYVVLGLPEDVGVRANGGRGGAYSAWMPALTSLLNLQDNQFLQGKNLMVLGEIDFSNEMNAVRDLDFHIAENIALARQEVEKIDEKVFSVMKEIFSAGKIPIVVGGGHNNSYPLLKALSVIQNKKVNAINCDAHADFRPLEGRHSGNGFSYAFQNNFLDQYAVVGLHENYNSQFVINALNENKERLHFSTFEEIFIEELISHRDAVQYALNFLKPSGNSCGVEIDLDTIQNIPSSAKTSSGINTIHARQYAYNCGRQLPVAYLHIAEAAPVLSHIRTDNKTGKLIAYIISDFLKGCSKMDESLILQQ